jgi:hypothetical protein
MGISCAVDQMTMKRQLDKFIEVSPLYLQMRGDGEAAEALREIKDPDRRMAAFWNYARYPKNKGKSIAEGWVWSDERIAAYKKSAEKRSADVAIAAVAQIFNNDPAMVAKDPGKAIYRLRGDTDPRNYDTQMDNWLREDAYSVVNYGKGLREQLAKEMSTCGLSPIMGDMLWDMDVQSVLNFGKLVEKYANSSNFGSHTVKDKKTGKVSQVPGLASPMFATPGLSDHGQSHAIDFKVYKTEGGKTTEFLGANGSERDKWRASGCAAALAGAIAKLNARMSRTVFAGPLKNPDEPWHWVYSPAPAAKAAN